MTVELSSGEIGYQLFSIAMDIKRGDHPYPREILKETGDWKWLPYMRHRASIALAYSPCFGFSREDAVRYVYGEAEESPLFQKEAKVLINNRFILPHPMVEDKPETITNETTIGGIGKVPLGQITGNLDHLAWYEPSLNFVSMRMDQEFDKPDRTVGITTGKWRVITVAHMNLLWKIRQKCDFMVVGVDPESYDKERVSDGFTPGLDDKLSFLRAITFPDGRKIDLLTKTHHFNSGSWSDNIYLPFALSDEFFVQDRSELAKYVAIYNSVPELVSTVRNNFSKRDLDRVSRMKYFLSSEDVLGEEKSILAALRGIKTQKISSVSTGHSSDLVRKFDLRVGP